MNDAVLIAAQLPEGRIDHHEPSWAPLERRVQVVVALVYSSSPIATPYVDSTMTLNLSWWEATYGFREGELISTYRSRPIARSGV